MQVGWFNDLNNFMNNLISLMMCIAGTIRELCEDCHSELLHVFVDSITC